MLRRFGQGDVVGFDSAILSVGIITGPLEGRDLEYHAFFPERCNVSVVTVAKDKRTIRMRVWERGTGEQSQKGARGWKERERARRG
eukprot:2982683-Rhodomonas_salina.1